MENGAIIKCGCIKLKSNPYRCMPTTLNWIYYLLFFLYIYLYRLNISRTVHIIEFDNFKYNHNFKPTSKSDHEKSV